MHLPEVMDFSVSHSYCTVMSISLSLSLVPSFIQTHIQIYNNGWFRIICAILAYFVLGSYYNYSQYGATGLDMIPHRDLWRDVPYIIGDLFKSTFPSLPRSGEVLNRVLQFVQVVDRLEVVIQHWDKYWILLNSFSVHSFLKN
jgi:hypothetical protein